MASSDKLSVFPTGWICDHCEHRINSPVEGYIEWQAIRKPDGSGIERNPRIVHMPGKSPVSPNCYLEDQAAYDFNRDGITMSMHLTDAYEESGVAKIIALAGGKTALPADEVLGLMQRLYIPGYDLAKAHFERAVGERLIESNLPEGHHYVSDIRHMLQEYADETIGD